MNSALTTPPAERAPSKLSIIFAGEDLTATLLDQSSVAVRVRAMPARHLARVLQLADKEAELLEFVCLVPSTNGEGEVIPGWTRVPPEWADNLTDESHAQLYEAAKRQNFSRAVSWAERQIAAKRITGELARQMEEVISPLIQRLMDPMMDRLIASLVLLAKSPTSPAAATPTS
ncbi:MAG: hypothetical protein Q8J74_00800 [Candidatus Didemnitutus sp.]|nr:hypothetical protein [Candidatus Didemnitutus sp.]